MSQHLVTKNIMIQANFVQRQCSTFMITQNNRWRTPPSLGPDKTFKENATFINYKTGNLDKVRLFMFKKRCTVARKVSIHLNATSTPRPRLELGQFNIFGESRLTIQIGQ